MDWGEEGEHAQWTLALVTSIVTPAIKSRPSAESCSMHACGGPRRTAADTRATLLFLRVHRMKMKPPRRRRHSARKGPASVALPPEGKGGGGLGCVEAQQQARGHDGTKTTTRTPPPLLPPLPSFFLGPAAGCAPSRIIQALSSQGKVSRLSGREAQVPHARRADIAPSIGPNAQRPGKPWERWP